MGQAPNRKSIVQQVSDADPARFRRAHTGQPGEDDWIKAVAATLHAEDPRWGLNGKRGDPNVLSLDVVTFRIGPTDRHVEAYDICGACGGGNPSVVWNDITNYATIGQPGTAIWVKPEGVPEPTPEPGPGPTPPPVDPSGVLARLDRLTAMVDALAGPISQAAHESLQAAGRCSDIKQQIANLPAAKPAPLYVGRIPKTFGGSSEVVFTPKEP